MKVQISVTQEDIAKGKRGRPSQCPVRHALVRLAAKGVVCADVNGYEDCQSIGVSWSARLQTLGGVLSFTIPASVVEKINAYDRGGDMEPFTFDVEI